MTSDVVNPTDIPNRASPASFPGPAPEQVQNAVRELREALAREQATVRQLRQKCAEQERIIAHLWERTFPLDQEVQDFQDNPPDRCRDLAGFEAELRQINAIIKEQMGK